MTYNYKQSRTFHVLIYIVLLIFAAGLPIVLTTLDPIWIGFTSPEPGKLVFELLAFSGSISILAAGAFECWRSNNRSVKNLLPLLVGMLVMFHTLSLVSEYSQKLWDFHCYESAAKALLSDSNPYENKTWQYQYPPLTAELMASAYTGVTNVSGFSNNLMSGPEKWDLLFYLFQFAQLVLVLIAYYLLYRLALSAGVSPVFAAVFVGGLLVVSNPLMRTLRWSQINLWILDITVAGILLRAKYPVVAGTVIAIGAHLKVYPAIIAGPWLLTKQWRAVISVIIGVIIITLFQTHGGQDWQTWKYFIEFMPSFPSGTFFRDNSLHSVAHNLLTGVAWVTGYVPPGYTTKILATLMTLAIIYWFLMRFIEREKMVCNQADVVTNSNMNLDTYRHNSHAIDAIAFTVIAAPSVWEHHYVLVMPVIIWAVAGWGRTQLVAITVGALLMFALPTFDVFLFSFHRVFGLLLVVWAMRSAPTGPPVFDMNVMQDKLPTDKNN